MTLKFTLSSICGLSCRFFRSTNSGPLVISEGWQTFVPRTRLNFTGVVSFFFSKFICDEHFYQSRLLFEQNSGRNLKLLLLLSTFVTKFRRRKLILQRSRRQRNSEEISVIWFLQSEFLTEILEEVLEQTSSAITELFTRKCS